MNIDWSPENFKVLREILGESLESAASKVGLTPQQLAEYEDGQRYVTMQILAQMSKLHFDNVYRIRLKLKESEESDGGGFLSCIKEAFPLSAGGSTLDPSTLRSSAFLDLLLREPNDGSIRDRVEHCASSNGIEIVEFVIKIVDESG